MSRVVRRYDRRYRSLIYFRIHPFYLQVLREERTCTNNPRLEMTSHTYSITPLLSKCSLPCPHLLWSLICGNQLTVR